MALEDSYPAYAPGQLCSNPFWSSLSSSSSPLESESRGITREADFLEIGREWFVHVVCGRVHKEDTSSNVLAANSRSTSADIGTLKSTTRANFEQDIHIIWVAIAICRPCAIVRTDLQWFYCIIASAIFNDNHRKASPTTAHTLFALPNALRCQVLKKAFRIPR